MKTVKKLLAMFMVLCLSIAVAIPAFADTTDGPTEAKNGVLQLTVQVFVDSEEIYRSSGTAFLINESHVVTNYHVIGFSTSDVEILNAIQATGADVEISYRVYSKRDVYREATPVRQASSAEMDFAVLELESPIGGRTPLALADSSEVQDLDAVYALGFPSDSLQVQDIVFHDSGDVAATRGVISKSLTVDGVNYFQHDATVSAGSSGGPLVNEDGAVIGINTLQGLTSQNFYIIDEDGTAVLQSYGHIDFNGAIKVNELTEVLDQAMIEYIPADGSSITDIETDTDSDVEATEEPVVEAVDTTALQNKVDEAKLLDSSKYTAESWGVVESNLETAELVLVDSAATQEQVDKKAADLDAAIKALEEEKGMNMALIGIIAAIVVVVIVLVVVLVVVLGGGKKTKSAPVNTNIPPMGTPNQPTYSQVPPMMNNYQTAATDEGAGETSVLSEGAGETTVLGGGGAANAYLIRTKNGEKIMLNSPNFVIGKEKKRVNYCIADNTSISRSHARIVKKGTQYFIVDMNSTNFTIVNGVKLAANIETPLENGAKIRLSDEDFEFFM